MAKKLFGDKFEDAPDPEDVTQIAFGMKATPYSTNGDMATVLNDLIAGFPESLGFLANVRIIVLRRASSRTDNEFHVASASGVWIRGDRERAVRADVDAGVWLQGEFWDRFNPMQRQAWLHHLLLRFTLTPKGALKLQRPDMVVWPEELRIYGAWSEQLKLGMQNFDAHEHPGPKPAAIARREAAATSTPVN
jgi:hypothetical protein